MVQWRRLWIGPVDVEIILLTEITKIYLKRQQNIIPPRMRFAQSWWAQKSRIYFQRTVCSMLSDGLRRLATAVMKLRHYSSAAVRYVHSKLNATSSDGT